MTVELGRPSAGSFGKSSLSKMHSVADCIQVALEAKPKKLKHIRDLAILSLIHHDKLSFGVIVDLERSDFSADLKQLEVGGHIRDISQKSLALIKNYEAIRDASSEIFFQKCSPNNTLDPLKGKLKKSWTNVFVWQFVDARFGHLRNEFL